MMTVRVTPVFHLSTFVMETSDCYEDDLDENIQEYIYRIYHCSNRSQSVMLRTNALKFIDQWRLQRLEQLDQRVRLAGQSILKAFDDYQSKRQYVKCSHRFKQSLETATRDKPVITNMPVVPIDLVNDQHHLQKIEISIHKQKPSSSKGKASFNLIDFGRDFTFETIAQLSSSSDDIAMIICENNTLIYSQHSNELVIVSLEKSKHIAVKQLDKKSIIRDLCYVDWLHKCLVIADEQIYLLDYRTTQCDIIDSGIGYLCGAIDNHRHIFYLIKQSTLYKYDQTSLLNLQADQYPIADGYQTRRIVLDNKSNNHLALLVMANDEKNYILVYSTLSLSNGYLYKIMIDDRIEREWICSNGNDGWLVRGTYPGSCFDLNINGLGSVRIFDCNEIRNIISMNEHQCFIIRSKTEIFVLIKYSFVQSFLNFNK